MRCCISPSLGLHDINTQRTRSLPWRQRCAGHWQVATRYGTQKACCAYAIRPSCAHQPYRLLLQTLSSSPKPSPQPPRTTQDEYDAFHSAHPAHLSAFVSQAAALKPIMHQRLRLLFALSHLESTGRPITASHPPPTVGLTKALIRARPCTLRPLTGSLPGLWAKVYGKPNSESPATSKTLDRAKTALRRN